MKIKHYLKCALVLLAGLICVAPMAQADVYLPKGSAHVNTSAPAIKSAEDAVSKIPFLSKIPHTFFIGDGYKFKLTGQELRIDHMGLRSRAPMSKRNCMVGFSFSSPVAFFGTRIDIPVMHAQSLKMSEWGVNTLGDYVARFSKDASVETPTYGLSVSARF